MMTAEQKQAMTDTLTKLVSPEIDEFRVTFILNAVVDYILKLLPFRRVTRQTG